MPFIQTSLPQSQSGNQKATTSYVYNMSFLLVTCLLNRWQRAISVRYLQIKSRGLTTPRSWNPLGTVSSLLQNSLPPPHRCYCDRDRGDPALSTTPLTMLSDCLPRQHRFDCCRDWGEPAMWTVPAHLQNSVLTHTVHRLLTEPDCEGDSIHFIPQYTSYVSLRMLTYAGVRTPLWRRFHPMHT